MNRIGSNNRKAIPGNSTSGSPDSLHSEELHQQAVNEFLTNVERIAFTNPDSPVNSKRKCSGDVFLEDGSCHSRKRPNSQDVSGDPPLHRDVEKPNHLEKQRSHNSQTLDKNTPLRHDDDNRSLPDEHLIQAVIAHDEQLNNEVTELFANDPYLSDEANSDTENSDGDWDCDRIKKCMTGCMLFR